MTSKKVDGLDNWMVQVRKGLLELSVLNALDATTERYGYDLVKSLMTVPGLGVTEGTVYPLLSRLRSQGLVATRLEESPEGPARKYYALTAKGRRMRDLMEEHVDVLARSCRELRGGGGAT